MRHVEICYSANVRYCASVSSCSLFLSQHQSVSVYYHSCYYFDRVFCYLLLGPAALILFFLGYIDSFCLTEFVEIMLLELRQASEMLKVSHRAYMLEIVCSFFMATNGQCQGADADIAWSLGYNKRPKLSSL